MDHEYSIVDSPCIFCGYDGQGYWQPYTHRRRCPWHLTGGRDERVKKQRMVVKYLADLELRISIDNRG